jgi:type III secretion protein N (ATPase)
VVDAVLSVGAGQRVGVFAEAGAGKSVFLGMLARNCGAEINVIALVGERGREVRDFIDQALGPEGLARSVVVVATSDRPAMERVRAANMATAIAEGFRARGRRVLLLMDSVTRFARALREVGLAAGEPAVRRGFPTSVFAELPRLFERTGTAEQGSITAFYSVLVEDDESDPIGEEVRSLLDGHIRLSRSLSEAGWYPPVDVRRSVSRLFRTIASPDQIAAGDRLRALLAKYAEIELLLQVGEFKAGGDPVADLAVARMPHIEAFLRQGAASCSAEDAVRGLLEAVG